MKRSVKSHVEITIIIFSELHFFSLYLGWFNMYGSAVPILHDTFEETPQNPDEWKEPGVHGLLEALLNEAQDDFAIPYPQNAS